jgi:hypothetical protein
LGGSSDISPTGPTGATGPTGPTGAGSVTSVSGTGTVSGITLSGTVTTTGSLTLGGALDLSSPPAIGGTTPNTIAGTIITSAYNPTTTQSAVQLTGTPQASTGGRVGVLQVGPDFTASDKNILAIFAQSINDYTQVLVQNQNAGGTSSADFIINNDNTTGSGVYGDFGINSSGFTGTGSLSLPNAVYLYSNGGDLVIGTNTANIVRFIYNAGSTDIGQITSTGLNSFPIGATTRSTGAFTSLAANGNVNIAAIATPTSDQVTITNTGFPVTTGGVSNLQIVFVGGAAAVESSAARIDLTPGSTTGGTWNGFRTVLTADANTGITANGIKMDTIASPLGGNSNGIYIGTGWNSILNYNGTILIDGTGNATFTTVSDSIGDVRTIVQNAQAGATTYTIVATDAGKHIYLTGTGGVTIAANIFTAGEAVTIINNTASSVTITQGANVTLYLAGTATTGNRTLAQRGLATAICATGTTTQTWMISGAGLT